MTVLFEDTFSPFFGLEDLQRAAAMQIFDHLNATLDTYNTAKAAQDEAFANHMGFTYEPITVEHVANENFYTGHRPSLIGAPITAYPNVAVWGVRSTPGAENNLLDHMSVYNDLLYVEVMVKAPSEDLANTRIQRLAECANACVVHDSTFGGAVSGQISSPVLTFSDVFTRKERTAYGPVWMWQGARLEYSVRKDVAPHNSSGTTSIFTAIRGLDPDGFPADFDQS